MATDYERKERLMAAAMGLSAMALAVLAPHARRSLGATSATWLAKAAGYGDTPPARKAAPLGQSRALDATITLAASPQDAYELFRQPRRFSQALPPQVTVEAVDPNQWQWVFGTADVPAVATWTTQVVRDVPGASIEWKSIRPSALASAGRLTFAPIHGGTHLTVQLRYAVTRGAVGDTLCLLSPDPADDTLAQILSRAQQLLEHRKES